MSDSQGMRQTFTQPGKDLPTSVGIRGRDDRSQIRYNVQFFTKEPRGNVDQSPPTVVFTVLLEAVLGGQMIVG